VRSGTDRPAAGSRRTVADGPRTSTDIDGGLIAVLFTRRRVLASGLFGGLLAAAGCSDSSPSADSVKIDNMSPGEYRDKQEELEAAANKKSRSRSKGKR